MCRFDLPSRFFAYCIWLGLAYIATDLLGIDWLAEILLYAAAVAGAIGSALFALFFVLDLIDERRGGGGLG